VRPVEIAAKHTEFRGARIPDQLNPCGGPRFPQQAERGQGDHEITQRSTT
jgi:hypothetical protein